MYAGQLLPSTKNSMLSFRPSKQAKSSFERDPPFCLLQIYWQAGILNFATLPLLSGQEFGACFKMWGKGVSLTWKKLPFDN